ncbi:Aldehyde/histidinol dehydrogenase [Trichoderma aethiopicum]
MAVISKPVIDITSYKGNIINGQFVLTAKTRHSIDPATEEPLPPVPLATKQDLDDAVKHAQAAFKTWSQTTFDHRAQLMLQYADAVEANRSDLERLNTMESGKPLLVSKTELDFTIRWLRAFATMQLHDEILEDDDERTVYGTYRPLGVCGAIVPWNWPVLLGLGKVGPALMTGNAVIMKPSPYAPYTDLKLCELAMAIFPPGVFQALSGDDALGPWMTEHPDISLITFTGSVRTGKLVAASCAKTLKRCILELGGNDALVVCEDVDIVKCLPKIATMTFINSGQICMLAKRIYVHEAIYDEFKAALVEFTKEHVKTGGGFEPGVLVGPIQNKMQFDLVKDMYRDVKASGYQLALDGRILDSSKGYFAEPTIVDNPPDASRIVVEEPFGLIVPLLKWSSDDEVVDRANSLNHGLGASVWCRDLVRAEKLARRLSAGSVWVNSHFDVAPNVPFGGTKESGIGREWGMEGFKQFTDHVSLWVWKKVFD